MNRFVHERPITGNARRMGGGSERNVTRWPLKAPPSRPEQTVEWIVPVSVEIIESLLPQ